MNMSLIEFVCTANHGRSPVAELIAQDHLRSIHADSLYSAVSSGSKADQVKAKTQPIGTKISYIQLGINNGLFNPEQIKEINTAIKAGDNHKISDYFNLVNERYASEEHQLRAEALRYFNIPGTPKKEGEQTMALPDRLAVLSMSDSNNKAVQKIYSASNYNPLISILSVLATGDPSARLEDAWGKGKELYFKNVETLLVQVPKAVDKLIK
jgi:protein-tyrosine-phosphatase